MQVNDQDLHNMGVSCGNPWRRILGLQDARVADHPRPFTPGGTHDDEENCGNAVGARRAHGREWSHGAGAREASQAGHGAGARGAGAASPSGSTCASSASRMKISPSTAPSTPLGAIGTRGSACSASSGLRSARASPMCPNWLHLSQAIGPGITWSGPALALLLTHIWPLNVRELRGVVERACAERDGGPTILPSTRSSTPPFSSTTKPRPGPSGSDALRCAPRCCRPTSAMRRMRRASSAYRTRRSRPCASTWWRAPERDEPRAVAGVAKAPSFRSPARRPASRSWGPRCVCVA
jgi:hypothetical protein